MNITDGVPAPIVAPEVAGNVEEMDASEEKEFPAKILEISDQSPSLHYCNALDFLQAFVWADCHGFLSRGNDLLIMTCLTHVTRTEKLFI